MVIFYLQNKRILPSFKRLQSLADKNDVISLGQEEGLNYLQDISDFGHALNKSYTDPNLQALTVTELLQEFFEFYADFDYNKSTICVLTGQEEPKSQREKSFRNDQFAIDIINPIDDWL